MNLREACRPCRGSCSLIPGRGCSGDLPGEEIVVSPPSPIVEPLNSRRWLSSHRQSLHSHGGHLQRDISSVLCDRGDESRGGLKDEKFMDFDYTPRTTAATSGDCLLLHTDTGSLKLNQGKIGLSNQTIQEVTSTPAHFWDRGARWFVVRGYTGWGSW